MTSCKPPTASQPTPVPLCMSSVFKCVEDRQDVYVLAASSRPDLIDPALLRPGRLDKSLFVGFPKPDERLEILMSLAPKINLTEEALALMPEIAASDKFSTFTGADIQAVLSTAQLLAVHAAIDERSVMEPAITPDHLRKAVLQTRPSVSAEDRLRYMAIYDRFIGGRTRTAAARDDAEDDAAAEAAAESGVGSVGGRLKVALG
eukprot:PLAT11389.3.p1 GENE.PLAT11389.3~~PLAT11389.3.p1  ORF type:complete len:204 (-),score=66.10 PLAT11389.3:63-674(-)